MAFSALVVSNLDGPYSSCRLYTFSRLVESFWTP